MLLLALHTCEFVKSKPKTSNQLPTLLKCRCGGEASRPTKVPDCIDRWDIKCTVNRCHAANYGQGLAATIYGWNQLAQHVYR